MNIRSLWKIIFKRKTFDKAATLNKNNIKGFLQGHIRSIKASYNNLDKHIIEQAAWRMSKAKKECVDADQCQACGCFPLYDKVLEDRQCEGKCYPHMMSSKQWGLFKLNNNIYVNNK